MPAHIPSIDVLESSDASRLDAELRLARLRSQVAVVRAFFDQVERLVPGGNSDGLGEQLIEEMARLGRRLIEMSAVQAAAPGSGRSGVYVREGRGSEVRSARSHRDR
jgi:hypothetical protein